MPATYATKQSCHLTSQTAPKPTRSEYEAVISTITVAMMPKLRSGCSRLTWPCCFQRVIIHGSTPHRPGRSWPNSTSAL